MKLLKTPERPLDYLALPVILAALSALVLILGKKMTAKDTIPLVPFLYVGILLTDFVR